MPGLVITALAHRAYAGQCAFRQVSCRVGLLRYFMCYYMMINECPHLICVSLSTGVYQTCVGSLDGNCTPEPTDSTVFPNG